MTKKKVRKNIRILLCFLMAMLMSTVAYSETNQSNLKKVTLNLKSVTIKEFCNEMERQTGMNFMYNSDQMRNVPRITFSCEKMPIMEVLDKVILKIGLYYNVEGNIVTIFQQVKGKQRKLTGVVKDADGAPLPGANIFIKGSRVQALSGSDGSYEIWIPSSACTVTYSYVGMKSQQFVCSAGDQPKKYNVQLNDENQLQEVVVTGIYTRKAESYTGSATTITSKDLMRVSNQNVFQSLKNLDPTIYIPDNMTMGSDPNTVPTMSMRGTSSFPGSTSSLKSNYQNQPNQPLFILDGFETTAENIMDMDMNRIESITILKDASAKALYGSKAANGVVVIETKRLAGNQQRVTYNGSLSFEMPDLTSYDLCNANEKLEVEQLEGMYTSSIIATQDVLTRRYNARKKLALEGLDTYWLSKPLHSGVGQKHNLNIELGDSRSLRAYLDFTYNDVQGVMKGSDRRNISGDVNISYRYKNILFKNILTIVSNKGEESPYGSFSDYAKMNPYWQAKDENGNVLQWVEKLEMDNEKIANPMYDAKIGTSFKTSYL